MSNPDRIVNESKKVFEDVMEDFHSLDYIKCHFEVWRRDYAECYREAYIGLCLPKLFNPLVRLQLITWNPLEVRHEVNAVHLASWTNHFVIIIFSLSRGSATILSTCSGLSRCCFMDLISRLRCRKGTEITACCLL